MARVFEHNTGAKIPSVGMGTYKAAPAAAQDALIAAVKVGLTLKKLYELGIVKHDDLFITSKLWCHDHAPEDVPLALDKTLKELEIDYVDLYLIHWPIWVGKGSGLKPENLSHSICLGHGEQWKICMIWEKLVFVGASNFSIKKLGDLLAIAHVPPAVNQAECHPAWQQTKLHAFCQEKGIHLSAYRPLGSPGTKSINVLTNPALNLVLTNPALNPVAERLGKSPAQIALRWGIKMGHSVLPKSTNEARIKENIDLFDWSVPEGMLPMFSEIKQVRLVAGEFAVHPNGVYKSLEELWDE